MGKSSVTVELKDRVYPIYIKNGILHSLNEYTFLKEHSQILLITNETVNELYGKLIEISLKSLGQKYSLYVVPDGEIYKSWDMAKDILDFALEKGLDRQSAIWALGGGVIGDLAGFVASIYMRGIDIIQIPTTLLAAVDSSVGGKVAVNHPLAKNTIGSFHQPRAVFMDISVLETLPEREYISGIAEIIKYGVILDSKLFDIMESSYELIKNKDTDTLQRIIQLSCEWKAHVVCKDEKDKGLRALLNLGHTFGHALEAISNYKTYLHGEAVAIGMVYAGKLALNSGLWSRDEQDRLVAVLKSYGLPTSQDTYKIEELIPFILKDKKCSKGQITFILPKRIGHADLFSDISLEDMVERL
ncbi:3-dehydroquinate synthase [PVC group bacterium (ex Bugula neritina AB1)]|nr:3-dehydroquinate synthase [PVC group bacterium (ex Bugula neritina AB1)]